MPDPVLMVVSILAITVFQLYWLQQNYAREKKTLDLKMQAVFRETIMHLQVTKLKLDGVKWSSPDSGQAQIKLLLKDDEKLKVRRLPKNEIVSTINVIRNKLKDTLRGEVKDGMVVTMNNASFSIDGDSVNFNREIHGPDPGNHIINMLYGVDSLQDSLRVEEIDSAYSKSLQGQKLDIPFTISKEAVKDNFALDNANEITVGFAHPVIFRLKKGNTFPYLIQQIWQPILFSILLLGLTILSFVLLYKNLLKQQRLSELKNEFISNITHELKTPIATVGVAIEALKNFNAIDDPKRTREYLDISQNELQRLSLLVDKVLKLSMFEKKEMDMKYEKVNLKNVVAEVVDSLRLQAEKYQASITVVSEGDLSLQGDRLHLLSVVFNLLDNALKYSKETPIVSIHIKEKENAVEMIVADNGIGIADQYKDKIFEKFFRIPHGDTHDAKGYGLGLSYAAGVVEKHHGTITVESQLGAGTSFIITFPKSHV
jgi:two-component system, OmpR family, phosphate regulon sensor histidine kinase PhoR